MYNVYIYIYIYLGRDGGNSSYKSTNSSNYPNNPSNNPFLPPDSLNFLNVSTKNLDPYSPNSPNMTQFGFPYCYGSGLVDSHFNTWGDCHNLTGLIALIALSNNPL